MNGAYPRGIHPMSHSPRPIEASDVGSHVKSTPEKRRKMLPLGKKIRPIVRKGGLS